MVEKRNGLSPKAAKAVEYYHSDIKHKLPEEANGRFVAIDAHTGEWLLGDSIDVSLHMRDRDPKSYPVVIQHPKIYARLWNR